MASLLSLVRKYNSSLDAAGLEVAQFVQLRRQIPPLYALLSLSAAALAFTHRNVAPALLTAIIPGLLIAACLARGAQWLLLSREAEITPETARKRLRATTVLACVFSLSFVVWAIALDQYGGPYERGHVTMFMAVTVLGCVFCLGYLPRAATLICVFDIGTFLAYRLIEGSEVLIAIAINIALVCFLILKVLRDSFAAFVRLEHSQQALDRKRAEAQQLSEANAQLALTDPLTGLPNRRFFFSELDKLLADPASPFSVGVIDLDGFKPVNDTYGHAQGDRLLQVIAERLSGSGPRDMVVARLGGDEFGILIKQGAAGAVAEGQFLCELISVPVPLGEGTVTVGCSIGLASYPEAGRTAHDLFDRSDFALYQAKLQRRGGCIVFSAELEKLIRSERVLDSALQAADLEQELSLVFQPVFDTRTREVVAVEALARWQSPKVGAVTPEHLIAAAERLGMARTTTLTLFGKALSAAAILPEQVRVTFNLSALDLADETTVTLLLDKLAASGVAPARIIFELTENSLITDLEMARKSLERLKQTGARLALDDFGTGFSSLSSLHQLPFDVLKIDRSFAARLNDGTGRRLVSAIHGLARTLSLQCVLEGIETERQLIEATLAGFDYAQGFYLARPGTIEDVCELLVSELQAA